MYSRCLMVLLLVLPCVAVRAQAVTGGGTPGTGCTGFGVTYPMYGASVAGNPTITRIFPNTAAQDAGFAVGDLILAVNGKEPTSAELPLAHLEPGSTAVIRVKRGDGEKTISVKIGKRVRAAASMMPDSVASPAGLVCARTESGK